MNYFKIRNLSTVKPLSMKDQYITTFNIMNNTHKQKWGKIFDNDTIFMRSDILIKLPYMGNFKPGELFKDLLFVDSKMNYIETNSSFDESVNISSIGFNNKIWAQSSAVFWFDHKDEEGNVYFDIGTSIIFWKQQDPFDSVPEHVHDQNKKLFNELRDLYERYDNDDNEKISSSLIFTHVGFLPQEFDLLIKYLDILES